MPSEDRSTRNASGLIHAQLSERVIGAFLHDETPIFDDIRDVLDQQFARLSGGSSTAGLLPLMSVVADATSAVAGLSVQTVQFRDAALYVGLSAQSLQALEQLKTWFETPRAARLEVQAANSGSEGVQIRIKLTPA